MICASIGLAVRDKPGVKRIIAAAVAKIQIRYNSQFIGQTNTFADLYEYAEERADACSTEFAQEGVVKVSDTTASEATVWSSLDFDISGWNFQLELSRQAKYPEDVGVFLKPLRRSKQMLPEWWPCKVHANIGHQLENADEMSWSDFTYDWPMDQPKPPGYGFPKLIQRSAISEAADVAEPTTQFRLKLRAQIDYYPLLSLLSAHIFHQMTDHFVISNPMSIDHMVYLLNLDSLPTPSEDKVLEGIIEVMEGSDCGAYAYDRLLRCLRWNYLSPRLVLKHSRKSAGLRSAAVTKTALSWLLGDGERPEGVVSRPRSSYIDAADRRPYQKAELLDWLLGGKAEDELVEDEEAWVSAWAHGYMSHA